MTRFLKNSREGAKVTPRTLVLCIIKKAIAMRPLSTPTTVLGEWRGGIKKRMDLGMVPWMVVAMSFASVLGSGCAGGDKIALEAFPSRK